jgi:hypothetical protein
MLGKVAQKLVPGYFSTDISLRSLTEKGGEKGKEKKGRLPSSKYKLPVRR